MKHTLGDAPTTTPGPSRARFAALRRWWRERRMADELHALDDALLKDIGLYRGEIPSIVRARCAAGAGWL